MEEQEPLAPPAAEVAARPTVGDVMEASPPWMKDGAGVGQAMIELLGKLEPRDALLAASCALVMFAGREAPRLGLSTSDYSVSLLQAVVGTVTKIEAMSPEQRQQAVQTYLAEHGPARPTDPPSEAGEGQG